MGLKEKDDEKKKGVRGKGGGRGATMEGKGKVAEVSVEGRVALTASWV